MPVDVRRGLLAGVAGLALAAAAPGAWAATDPEITVDPSGTAHVGWVESPALVGDRGWSAAGSLSDAQAVSGARAQVLYFDMGTASSGATTYAWVREGTTRKVEGRRRRADGSLGPLLSISSPLYAASDAGVAVGPGGSTVFTWRRSGDTTAPAQARRLSAAGVLGPIQTLSADGYRSFSPAAAVDAAGNALVAWVRRDEAAGTEVVQSRRIAADGTLGAVQTLSTASPAIDSTIVAFDAGGNALVGWLRFDGVRYVPQVRRRAANGTLSAIESLTTGGGGASHLRLAVDPDGDAMMAWSRLVNGRRVVQARHRTAAGALGSVLTLSPAGDRPAVVPEVAIDDDGNAIVVWQLDGPGDTATSDVFARRRAAGGTVGPVVTVAADGGGTYVRMTDPQIAFADDGTASIVWHEFDETSSTDSIAARRRRPNGTLGSRIGVDGP